ncbi:MAG: hypothetical protein KDC14_12035 [Planctomycetes bacterium]|nr:hypothetical protein [Planctomycetota bacterium]
MHLQLPAGRTALVLGVFALLSSTALANNAPYDGTGFIIQGPNCVLYQDDLTGQIYGNGDAGGYGGFGVGDHVHIVSDQYPCFLFPCTANACIGSITLIESFGAGQDPTTPFCFGDGSSMACPCANHSALGADEGCANSTGSGAKLTATGSSFVADDNVVLHVEGARDSQPGVFVQGRTQIETPFRDGLLCMGNPTERLQVVFTDASGAADSSVSLVTAGAISPGDTVHYQLWYRDPVVSPCGTGSNLSSAGTLTWQ